MKLKPLFNELFKSVKIDKSLAERVGSYRMAYLVRNAEFYSQPYIGVVPLYFKQTEVAHFYNEIIGLDPNIVHKGKLKNPNIDPERITGDSFNLTLFYLAHKTINSTLPVKTRQELAGNFITLFCYVTLAALCSSRFNKFLATKREAHGTYESLSNRFLIKQLKSWSAFVEYRVNMVLDPKGIHYKRLSKMDKDLDFLAVIMGLQTAIRDSFNQVFSAHVNVVEDNSAASTSSQTEERFGEEETVDVTDRIANHIANVIRVLPYPEFHDSQLVGAVVRLDPLVNQDVLTTVVKGLSRLSTSKDHRMATQFVSDSLSWCYYYVHTSAAPADASRVLKVGLDYLRGGVSSSRNHDASLTKLRTDADKVIKKIITRSDRQYVNIYRRALILYLYTYMMLKVK